MGIGSGPPIAASLHMAEAQERATRGKKPMTEQFSQEYIDYILSDEAKRLQDRLPRGGEGIWFIKRRENMFTGKWNEWSTPHCLGEEDVDYIVGYQDYEDQEFVIVPTLWQLLNIIEGAGWAWSRKPGRWDAWKPTVVPLTASEWGMVENTEDMLAAAKLAVKAVEGQADREGWLANMKKQGALNA